jgi:hypothetical protein
MNLDTVAAHYFEFQLSVIKQNPVAGLNVTGQILIIGRDNTIPAFNVSGGDDHFLAASQRLYATTHHAGANFWPLEIAKNRYGFAVQYREFTNLVDPDFFLFQFAVGKIQPEHINSGLEQIFELLTLATGRPYRGNNFGVSVHSFPPALCAIYRVLLKKTDWLQPWAFN